MEACPAPRGGHHSGGSTRKINTPLAQAAELAICQKTESSRLDSLIGAAAKLASKTDLKTSTPVTGSVSGVMVRTREQTPAEYSGGVKVDRWETVPLEIVLPVA